ncbi:MAG: DUF2726 domain-containing protein, partial [Anaerolineales bacterium]
FLSPAELSFYHVLRQVVGGRAVICAKVSLSDLFYAQTGDYGQNRGYNNRIDRKHVDFLLCDPQTMEPLAGVELDDASHRRSDRQERDAFVDGVFEVAGVPLVHVPAQAGYALREVTARLEGVGVLAAESPARVNDRSDPPQCPSCGIPMVLRTAQRGPHKGEQFYACSNYPECKELLPVTR